MSSPFCKMAIRPSTFKPSLVVGMVVDWDLAHI